MTAWECVVGLEVHIQLATQSKIFSGAATTFGSEPNSQACLIDVALPGVLPVCNMEVVRMAVKFGLATGATINKKSIFARKNYFYPDLPKGYQISQYESPIVTGGTINTRVNGTVHPVNITRAHLEEDAGKSLHDAFDHATGIDLNRAGTPLLEIVSEPEIRSAAQAADYLRRLHILVRYLGICDGNLQDGSMRCDANISVRPKGTLELGTRTELKNINSFRFVERGIEAEYRRQVEVLENNGTIVQQTRQYDPATNRTSALRDKEDAQDYRYFPDPDLPPLVLTQEFIDSVAESLPELPDTKLERFINQYGLTADIAAQLAQSNETAKFFEQAVQQAPDNPRSVANWMTVELAGLLNRDSLTIRESPISASQLAQIVARIDSGEISGNGAKSLLASLWETPNDSIDAIIERENLRVSTDRQAIEDLVAATLSQNQNQVQQYREGNRKVLGYLVGQVMKNSPAKIDPKQVNQEIVRRIESSDD